MKTRRPEPSGSGSKPPRKPSSAFRSSREPTRTHPHFLYGRNAVSEALQGRRKIRRLVFAEGIHKDARIDAALDYATTRGIQIEQLPRAIFDDLLGTVNHQGIALEVGNFVYVSLDEAFSTVGTVLALDHIQDPQNFGTLLRTAEAVGVSAVLIPANRAVGITPAVVNASAGAVEHLKIAQLPNLAHALEFAKKNGWWIAGLATGDDAQNLFTSDDLPSPLVLVIGSEGSGISPNIRKQCDLLLALPMVGRVASLNAATAGSIALYELLRRSRTADKK